MSALAVAPPPARVFEVPIEVVDRLATSTGKAFMLRAILRKAVFNRIAVIETRGDRFIGRIFFVEPIGPERQDEIVVTLDLAHPRNDDANPIAEQVRRAGGDLGGWL